MTEAVRRLGKYEIIGEIGKGGFATVYRARDLDLGREVALKVLDPLLTRDPVWVARFRREARAAATLDHPRIVTVHEIGQSEGALFIAMKLVEGGSLAQRLAGDGSLPWDEAVRVVGQVAEALDYAHGQGVLHRDLKPANVLLDPRSGAVLTDFGFARLLADNSLSVSMSGGIVGTPATMAPEVWEGQEPTVQADVYALGCILYELVTGRPLFSGATPPAVMLAHFKPLLLPEAWPEGTPPGLGEVLQTALARDPAARYARAGDLAAAVAALSVDRLAEPYVALQAAVAGQQWQQALALAAEIKGSQPDYRDVAALERQALAGLEQAARAQSAAQWRATAEETLAAGDLAAAQLALKQWQSVMPEDPALASTQVQLKAEREAAQAAEESAWESKTAAEETMIEQAPMATPPPVNPPVSVASAERPPSSRRSVWALLAVGVLAAIVVLALAVREGGEQPGTSVAFVETTTAPLAMLLPTDTLVTPTSTSARPMSTRVQPTDTPERAIDTPVPPTDTPAPPTAAPSPTRTPTPRPDAVMGIVLPSEYEPRWLQDEARFRDLFAAANVPVEILFSQDDSAKEKSNVESLLAKGAKVIILVPHDGAVAAAAAEAARQAGAKVISYDRMILGTDAVDYYVTFSNFDIGKAQAQYLVDEAEGSGNPLYLYAGAAYDHSAFDFFEGAWNVLQPKIADGTFVVKNSSEAVTLRNTPRLSPNEMGRIFRQIATNWDPNTAKNLAESNLAVAPVVDKGNVFILGPNDGTARAIADAFAADNDVESYVITGQDAEKASIQYIIDGKQSMTVLKDVRTLAKDAVDVALAFLQRKPLPQNVTYGNGEIAVPSKLSDLIVVDMGNLKAAIIDSGYYPASDFTGLK